MPATLMPGGPVADAVFEGLRPRIEALRAAGHTPGLATVLVGDDGPSANYVAMKHRDAEALGIASFDVHLPADATDADVLEVIHRYNGDPAIDAYLLQYPFPKGLDYEALVLRADPAKDVDGLHPVNLGKLVMGVDGPLPCTPAGIVELLHAYDIELAGAHVVVIGRGLTIGRPLANLLALKRPGLNAAVTVLHTGVSRDRMAALSRQADVLVAAAGSPGLVTPEMVQPGAAVVAAGVSFEGKRIISDVADEVAEVAGWLSPRVGGVGPMTRAMLLVNCVEAAERRARGASTSA
jgi:methylenetetrahydrofolate dehydrogenase (NADP+)/methenyltetrahydrofolate cyclohydrolase